MEDISDLPQWQASKMLAIVQKSPLTIKNLKIKLDRIYMINGYNEKEYLSDVVDAYVWIKLVAQLPYQDALTMFENEKTIKFFIEDFIFTTIKYMELCRSFKLIAMMLYTQQIMVEGLRVFSAYFDQLEKFPRMTLILKHTFDFDKQFFKINYANQYHCLVVPPTKQQIQNTEKFIQGLKVGDKVDVLKVQHQSRRTCWLPGTFRKSSALYLYIRCDHEKTSLSIDLNTLQVRPYQSMKDHYEWRINLKVGDKIDYMKDIGCWVRTQVQQIRENVVSLEENIKCIQVKVKDDNQYWVSITDPKIQREGSVTQIRPDGRQQQQFFYQDFTDYILDPQMKQTFITRPQTTKSMMIIELLNILHKQLHILERIAQTVKDKTMKIQVVAELINIILIIHPLFHRRFSVQYLSEFTRSILQYINNGKQGTIRNFSKERYEAVMTSIQQFMKRLYPSNERKQIVQRLQLDLYLRFLYSDFLDRKLQAVSLLTAFFKMCRHGMTKKSMKEFVQWIRENKILAAIYNDKSHSQLIAKSNDFLKFYLQFNPPVEQLQPLLIWNEAVIKLVAQNFDDLPSQIQNSLVQKIKSKTNVTNPDALNIIKKTPNCQAWLLQNGGQCWVQVVRGKNKRKPQIIQVFKYPFPVVNKITKQMNQLYQSNFKTLYFSHMFEINYLCKVLENQQISLSEKLQFITLATQLIKKISDQVFELLLRFLINSSQNQQIANKYQKFFVSVMPKLHTSHLQKLFQAKFSKRQQLQNLTQTQFTIFQKCFVGINENIQEERSSQFFSHSKKPVLRAYILNCHIQDLVGIDKLQQMLFYSKNDEICKKVIMFVGLLLSSIKNQQMKFIGQEYIDKLLQKGEVQLYATINLQNSQQKILLQQKYLKIIQQLLNQTQTKGIDQEPSVNALFPLQKLFLRIIDHFNSPRTKIFLQVPSNITLYELRSQICKHINAYLHQTKIIINGQELSDRYNGHVVHVLDLSADIIITKVAQIPRVALLDQEGKLVQKARNILVSIFNQYSSFGLMSKKQCIKYHQKCVGSQVMSQGQTKVQKIYEQFDKDKDGYLTQNDFLSFYQTSSKTKQHFVWSNLQAFGVRNDLQILDSLPIQFPQRNQLARNRLFDNQNFMKLLFELLASPDQKLAETAWKLAARLPLYSKFNSQMDLSKQYLTRYWLYVVENKGQFDKITKQILSSVFKMSIQTACIGLKVTYQCQQIDVDIFKMVVQNLKNSNSIQHMDFFHKVILDYSLKIFTKFIKDQKIADYYVNNLESINKIFREGIMSINPTSRQIYCHTLSELIQLAVQKQFKLFQSLFNLIYRIFDNCELSTLNMQYFQLFTHLLTILKLHGDLLPRLNLNWGQLTQEIIQIYKSHQCTQTSMTSKPDQVAQGLLKIITKLINTDTIQIIVNLVPFIFQQSLFPQKGRNKLKTSKSRQDAYQLIYEICKYEISQGKLSGGLQKLFGVGFKQIYKKMSSKKSEVFSYYYYSYNEPRSQLGYAGIRNLGCICYMISMLQQLNMTVPFRNLILMADDGQPQCLSKRGTKQIDDNIFHQLKIMFSYLLLTEKQQYNPDEFCYSWKDFDGQPVNTSIQQDAQQFLNLFFDKLQTSLKNTPFKHILENVFGGKTCSQMTCSGCGATKQRSQNFYPLSLQIKGFKNIQQSFNKYITGEVISDYQCDSCKNKCDVTKRNFLQKTPNYFIVHLQRMCFNYDRLQNQKVNSRWQFPHDLNVYNYTLSRQKGLPEINNQFSYKLKGVVVHYGTADFGHYFSYIKESDQQWLQFNDERVRQFDPSDIEIQCFGGEHWRRESQSAYLLVYERQIKSHIVLQFSSNQEKVKIIQQFKLTPAIIQQAQQQRNQSQSQVSKVDSSVNQQMSQDRIYSARQKQQQKLKEQESQTAIEKSQSQISKSQTEKQGTQKQPQQKKIIVHLDMHKITQNIPKGIKDKIDQQNDQFSFTMNLSNNEFANFIYHILTIDPPQNLREQFLQLCYQCLNLKQTIKTQHNKMISVSEWALQRFNELIEGHGFQFMKNFTQNWESDILSIQKSTKTITKCLLHSVISDIIRTNNLNSQFQQTQQNKQFQEERLQKRKVVIAFLDRLLQMMLNQVIKHWTKFAQYFQLWISLVKQNYFVRRYCQEKMIIQRILEFVMQQGFPYPRAKKRHTMANQLHSAEFEYPLALLHTLLQHGYELNQMEKTCFRTYAFMGKIICYRVEGANIIETLCKNNNIISQKMGFLLLSNCSSVQQSDQVKPIISSIHQYLNINDDLKQRRIQWIVGFPTYIEHSRQKGFGSYGCIPSTQPAVKFLSALGTQPILELLMKFKKKSQHVALLLMSMLLQLEHDGLINNLDQYPSKMALQRCYTVEFQSFINAYYQDTQRPYTGRNYTEYGQRAKKLWDQRPKRPMVNQFPRILLGKVIQQTQVKQQVVEQIFEIKQYNIKTFYLPLQSEGSLALTGKNILTVKNNSNFVCSNLPKQTKSYGHYSYSLMKVNSSDQQQNEQAPQQSVFEKTKQGWLLRKIQIVNRSSEDMLLVFRVADGTQCNLHVPTSPISAQIQSNSSTSVVLIKKDLESQYGELNIVFNILGKATNAGYMPKQIITEVDQKVQFTKAPNSDDDEEQCSSEAYN